MVLWRNALLNKRVAVLPRAMRTAISCDGSCDTTDSYRGEQALQRQRCSLGALRYTNKIAQPELHNQNSSNLSKLWNNVISELC